MVRPELVALFMAILKKKCGSCHVRRRKFCGKAFAMCLALSSMIPPRRVRRYYVRPAHADHMDVRFITFDGYLGSMDETSFHEYTRLTPEEFAELHGRVAHRIVHSQTHRAPVSTMHRLALTLRFLGHGSSFVATAHDHHLGKSTVRGVVYECCQAIIEEFWSEAFPVPCRAAWQQSTDEFRDLWKYPRGVASIDGKHFRCFAPTNSGSSFYNYKGYFSFVLLAVVSGAYRVLAFDLGGKGRNSDAGLFRTSGLKRFLERAVNNFPTGGDLGGEGAVDYHILADGGFGQLTWMQRPFRQAEVGNDMLKAHFNRCFSSARRIVESVFGIICARFRIFQRALIGTEDHCKLIVAAALVLHNLLVDRVSMQQLVQRYTPAVHEPLHEPLSRAVAGTEARLQRQRMVNYFARRDGLLR
ncbi:unnamed protein product [Heligmosomoides polygyrus]|uniref:DDE Tnp4 domain-containing protein n=1 Tax=Heligmosomoides polygyrus TaxID=6339 RepID=A0A183FIT6_HELPZ|nr:unnamed protein product [Heligmosomoides polygyrus]